MPATAATQGMRRTWRAIQAGPPVRPEAISGRGNGDRPIARRRSEGRWSRLPMSTSSAGTSVRAAATATRAASVPATPTDHRTSAPMSVSPANDAATVNPENSAVRPAVVSAVVMQSATSGSRRPVRRRRRGPGAAESSSPSRASSSR